MSEPQVLEFRLSAGITLKADAYGNPSDAPVILAHGGGQTRYAWGNTAAELAKKGYYAVAVDQRGHGQSDWHPDGDYRMLEFANDLVQVAANFSTAPVLVGASLGGLAAVIASHLQQHKLWAALVLVDITPQMEMAGVQRIIDFMQDRMEQGFASLDEVADFIAEYQPQRQRSKNLDGLAKNLRVCEDGRYRWHWDPKFITGPTSLQQANVLVSLDEAIQGLSIPALLVRGRMSDVVSMDNVAHFQKLVPHAEFVDVADAGHMVAGDRNDRFCSAVVGFLTGLK